MAFVKLADNYTDLIGKFAVALLAEGVDRNGKKFGFALDVLTSPSSRRAWIEIPHNPTGKRHHAVALLAEGAGRNRHKNMVNSY